MLHFFINDGAHEPYPIQKYVVSEITITDKIILLLA